jgi:hypothetical protein
MNRDGGDSGLLEIRHHGRRTSAVAANLAVLFAFEVGDIDDGLSAHEVR